MIRTGSTPESIYGTGGEKYEAYKAQQEQAEPPTSADRVRANWRSKEGPDGEPLYWDSVAQLWLTIDEAVRNVEGRQRFRDIMGDHRDVAAVNDYERSRGL